MLSFIKWYPEACPTRWVQRELGYTVYLVGYGGEWKGRKGRREEEKERGRAASPEEGQIQKERETETETDREHKGWRGGRRLGSGRLGVGGVCLLKGQGTQVTGQVSRLQQ